jgi:hypothetical protein
VYIGIQNVTNDGFILMIDDISVSSVLGVPGENPQDDLKVFPNPAHEQVNINFGSLTPGKVSINISDALGKSVLSFQDVTPGSNLMKIDVTGLHAGIYFMRIEFDHQSRLKKIAIVD